MKYKASLDNTSKIITLLISLLFLFIISFQCFLFFRFHNWSSLASIFLLIIIYAIAYWYHPVSYGIKDKNIVVYRHASDVVLSRTDIKNIELIDTKKLSGTIRTFGVGGMFGYFGQFLNRDIGCMTWYATQRDRDAVLIEMNNSKKIIITPDDPQQFIQQVNTAA